MCLSEDLGEIDTTELQCVKNIAIGVDLVRLKSCTSSRRGRHEPRLRRFFLFRIERLEVLSKNPAYVFAERSSRSRNCRRSVFQKVIKQKRQCCQTLKKQMFTKGSFQNKVSWGRKVLISKLKFRFRNGSFVFKTVGVCSKWLFVF